MFPGYKHTHHIHMGMLSSDHLGKPYMNTSYNRPFHYLPHKYTLHIRNTEVSCRPDRLYMRSPNTSNLFYRPHRYRCHYPTGSVPSSHSGKRYKNSPCKRCLHRPAHRYSHFQCWYTHILRIVVFLRLHRSHNGNHYRCNLHFHLHRNSCHISDTSVFPVLLYK